MLERHKDGFKRPLYEARLRRLFSSVRNLQGYIDFVDFARIIGWAAYAGGQAPQLMISLNKRKVGQIVPNIERADLLPLFPNNIRLGFNFRFPMPLTKDATIAVVDQRGYHLSKSPYKYIFPRTEWLNHQKRAALAAHYIKGSGIEIGALHEPLSLPAGVEVKYVDRLSRGDLYKHYPELGSYDLIEPDIISDGETLSEFDDHSVDFIIANHFIEHTQDPISTLQAFLRVLRTKGVIFMAVPDKRWSFDKDREVTTFSHLVRDHEEGPQISRNEHYVEWVRDKERLSEEDLPKRVSELSSSNYSIHFHVWDALSFMGFLSDAASRYCLPIQLCAVVANTDEFVVVLQKTS